VAGRVWRQARPDAVKTVNSFSYGPLARIRTLGAAALQREGVPFDAISVTSSTDLTSTLSTTASDGTPEGK
jgi:hypothetical protein